MQRSSVDLPEPHGPSTQTTSPRLIVEVDAAQHLELAEALVDALEVEHGQGQVGDRCRQVALRGLHTFTRRGAAGRRLGRFGLAVVAATTSATALRRFCWRAIR